MITRAKLALSGQIAVTLLVSLIPFTAVESWFYSLHLKTNSALSRLFTADERPTQTLLLETDPADFLDSDRLRQIRQQLLASGARSVWMMNAFSEISKQVGPDGILRTLRISESPALSLVLESKDTTPLAVAWRTQEAELNPVCRWSLNLKKCGDLRNRVVVVIPFGAHFTDVTTPQGSVSEPQLFAQTIDAVRTGQTLQFASWGLRVALFLVFSVLLTVLQSPAMFPILGLSAFALIPQFLLGTFHLYLPIAGAVAAFFLRLSLLGYLNVLEKKQTRMKFDFILSLSHELKTPLARLFLGIDRGKSELITRSAHELKEQIDSLLRLAKLESMELIPTLEPCFVDQVIQDTLQSYRLLLEQKKIQTRFQSGIVFNLLSDPRILQLIFSNLVSNTYRHAPEGSTVTITSREEKEHVVISWNSPGISDSYQLSAKPAAGSSGSGVYICVRLAQLLGGTFYFDAMGEIPTFIITLPIASNLAKSSTKLVPHS